MEHWDSCIITFRIERQPDQFRPVACDQCYWRWRACSPCLQLTANGQTWLLWSYRNRWRFDRISLCQVKQNFSKMNHVVRHACDQGASVVLVGPQEPLDRADTEVHKQILFYSYSSPDPWLLAWRRPSLHPAWCPRSVGRPCSCLYSSFSCFGGWKWDQNAPD